MTQVSEGYEITKLCHTSHPIRKKVNADVKPDKEIFQKLKNVPLAKKMLRRKNNNKFPFNISKSMPQDSLN